jgi:crotonobetainyl-CoA:carnitine CoA-transferase CaiB-like acyl-CoA transferase
MLGQKMERNGSRDRMSAPANLFPSRDGYLYMHAGTDPLFRRLVQAMGRPELQDDERFVTVAQRMANVEELEGIVTRWLSELSTEAAGEILDQAGIPYSKVMGLDDISSSEQIRAREMLVDIEHPEIGVVTLPGVPIKMSAAPGSIRKPPPLIGEDNDYIFGGLLGYDSDTIRSLRDRHVI